MIIWTILIHALAYFPTPNVSDMLATTFGFFTNARANWKHYQWCGFVVVFALCLYPFIAFYSLIVDGFDPYSDLSAGQKTSTGGMNGFLCYFFRVVLHTGLIILIVYAIVMTCVLTYIQMFQRYPGQYAWIAVKMGKLPLGAIWFQAGEKFDCAICFTSMYDPSGETKVVKTSCGHYYKEQCLRTQIVDHNNKYCVLSG